jgi:hypothetical protein
VAIAPDQPLLFAVRDDAVEMGADSGKSANVGLGQTNDDHRIRAETNDLELFVDILRVPDRPRFDFLR